MEPTKSLHAYALACCKVGKEIWRNVSDFPEYEVSNMGRLRRLDLPTKFLGHERTGYIRFKSHGIHRFVAFAFIPNPAKKLTVDHFKSNEKINNRVDNLRWATNKEQANNKTKTSRDIKRLVSSRAVWRCDKDTSEKIEYYETVTDAAHWIYEHKASHYTGDNIISGIKGQVSCVAQGRRNHSCGFKWIYDDLSVDNEIWREVPPKFIKGIPDMKVSSYGRIMNHKGRISIGHLKKNDTRRAFNIARTINGKKINVNISCNRIVALVFLENDDPENKTQVDHKDGNPSNDCLSNLEWVTPGENMRRMYELKIKHNTLNRSKELKDLLDKLRDVVSREPNPKRFKDGRYPPISKNIYSTLVQIVKLTRKEKMGNKSRWSDDETLPNGLLPDIHKILELHVGSSMEGLLGIISRIKKNLVSNTNIGSLNQGWSCEINNEMQILRDLVSQLPKPKRFKDGRFPPLSKKVISTLECFIRTIQNKLETKALPYGIITELSSILEKHITKSSLYKRVGKIYKNVGST